MIDSSNVLVSANTITLDLVFINAGQTPAYDVRIYGDTGVFEQHDDLPALEQPDEDLMDKFVIGPGRTRHYIKHLEVTPSDLELVKGKEKRAYIWGEARYRDIFGGERYLRFQCRAGSSQGDWLLQPTKGGETAN